MAALRIYPLDPEAQQRAEAHLPLADTLARQQYRRCRRQVPLDELSSEALVALTDAAGRFDVQRGIPFGAYVTVVIRRRLTRTVALWRRQRLAFICFTDLAPASRAGQAPDEAICRSDECDETIAVGELIDKVRQALPARWFVVLQMYYLNEHSLEAVGQQIGLSRERVRKLVAKSLQQARRLLRAG